MNLTFPEWIPSWAQFVILILTVTFGICFLFMPFAVFGLKGRLNYLSQQMEDIQAQLHILLKRTADLRSRSETKIQVVANHRDDTEKANKIENSEKKLYEPENYVYPLPALKKRFAASDISNQNSCDVSRSSLNKFGENIGKVEVKKPENNFDKQAQKIYVENGEEGLYDPPSSHDEKKEVINLKKRKEPILRWPPL